MGEPVRFSFTGDRPQRSSYLPFLPLTLIGPTGVRILIEGLLDTGATVNVLPYQIGLELGGEWNAAAPRVQLTGNLARDEAQALLLHAEIADFPRARLVFAWTKSEGVPVILGQVNFFMEFNVCFYGSRLAFDVRPKGV